MTLSVSQITPAASAGDRHQWAISQEFHPSEVAAGNTQVETRSTALTDEQRERAICSAGVLLEVFHAEHELHELLWKRDGCFSHKGAADKALANAQTAFRLMQDLIRNRSAAQIARMEREMGLDVPSVANE